jgi:hypothetical protein
MWARKVRPYIPSVKLDATQPPLVVEIRAFDKDENVIGASRSSRPIRPFELVHRVLGGYQHLYAHMKILLEENKMLRTR